MTARTTLSLIREYFYYDPTSKRLHWKTDGKFNKGRAGKPAGYRMAPSGYCQITFLGKREYAHRLIWMMFNDRIIPDGFSVDHIDHDRTNDDPANLRVIPNALNARNRSPEEGVRFTGVSWYARVHKWQAVVTVNNRPVYLGIFDNFDDAKRAREAANKKYGFHPNHGKVMAAA